MKSQKQYGLSIDADVALWMESRMTEGKPMLDGMGGFVFINSELHDNFDSFNSQHCSQGYSTFPYISLLKKWNEQRAAPSSPFKLYLKMYVALHTSEVDELCDWVYDFRSKMSTGTITLDSVL